MKIYPAVHYTMGGLWVDYNLQSTLPGLFVIGEANFSDHGANRLGASALMQGLADGYFIIPYTIGDYFATGGFDKADTDHPAFRESENAVSEITARLLGARGKKTVEVTAKAEQGWVEQIVALAGTGATAFLEECTPGYYNREGKGSANMQNSPYAPGINAFNDLLAKWREQGGLDGMALG